MQKRLSTGQTLDERQLFHGTRKENIEAICQQGFDWRVSGTTTGCMYGKGSYFAKAASYSHGYATSSKALFLVRVLVGVYARGSAHFSRPPSKPGQKLELYDSCVDNDTNPSIFVIFDQAQAYPEYLIKY